MIVDKVLLSSLILLTQDATNSVVVGAEIDDPILTPIQNLEN